MPRSAASASTSGRSPGRNRRLTRSPAPSVATGPISSGNGLRSSTVSMSSVSSCDSVMPRLAASAAKWRFVATVARVAMSTGRWEVMLGPLDAIRAHSGRLTSTAARLSCPQPRIGPIPSACRRVTSGSRRQPPCPARFFSLPKPLQTFGVPKSNTRHGTWIEQRPDDHRVALPRCLHLRHAEGLSQMRARGLHERDVTRSEPSLRHAEGLSCRGS